VSRVIVVTLITIYKLVVILIIENLPYNIFT